MSSRRDRDLHLDVLKVVRHNLVFVRREYEVVFGVRSADPQTHLGYPVDASADVGVRDVANDDGRAIADTGGEETKTRSR
jgi:hypothetical protein